MKDVKHLAKNVDEWQNNTDILFALCDLVKITTA